MQKEKFLSQYNISNEDLEEAKSGCAERIRINRKRIQKNR